LLDAVEQFHGLIERLARLALLGVKSTYPDKKKQGCGVALLNRSAPKANAED
jgi:hypothetical protein